MKQSTVKTIISCIAILLFSFSVNAKTLDKGKNSYKVENVTSVEEVSGMITNLALAIDINFKLSYSDENKSIYFSEKTVIVAENTNEGFEVKVLCGSRKPNREYKKVVNALKSNPALTLPMSELE